jgi:hypothetical protein
MAKSGSDQKWVIEPALCERPKGAKPTGKGFFPASPSPLQKFKTEALPPTLTP